jgi:hypothetical protein
MMRSRQIGMIIISLFFIYTQVQVTAQHRIEKGVLGNGAAVLSGPGHRLNGLAGQPVIGTTDNETHTLQTGFWYQAGTFITGVDKISDEKPTQCRLEQNYPNPFNPETTIRYFVESPCHVDLKILDLRGRKIISLVDETQEAGEYTVRFNASGLATGVYVYQIRMKNFVDVKKMVLLE